jgi:2-deoxy-D-gluconate 3-dehydrogenase
MTNKSFLNKKKNQQRSDRTILGQWGTRNDIASAAIFLSSSASRYITGTDLIVDGGWLAKGI